MKKLFLILLLLACSPAWAIINGPSPSPYKQSIDQNPINRIKMRLGIPVLERGPGYDMPDSPPVFIDRSKAGGSGYYQCGTNQGTVCKAVSSLYGGIAGTGGSTGANSITSGTGDTIKSDLTFTFIPGQVTPISPSLNSDVCGEWLMNVHYYSGYYYALVHNEGPCDYHHDFTHGGYTNESMTLWKSTSGDPGTWSLMTVLGVSPGTILSSDEAPELNWLTGIGDCTMFPDDKYIPFYMYVVCGFKSDNAVSDYKNLIARAPIANMEPGNWKLLYNGSYSAPGLNNHYDTSTLKPQADMFNWIGPYASTMPGTPFKILANATDHVYWYPSKESLSGNTVSISMSLTNPKFQTIPEPLIYYDKQEFINRNVTPYDVTSYPMMLSNTDGSNLLGSTGFDYWYMWVPPYNSLACRYVTHQPVTFSIMSMSEKLQGVPQAAVMLETYHNTSSDHFRTTIVSPYAAASECGTESNWVANNDIGYIRTSCPNSQTYNDCDAIGAQSANKIEECINNAKTDYQLNIGTRGVDGNCPSGWVHERTVGWLYKYQQPFAKISVYACEATDNSYHFSSIDPNCNGQTGQTPVFLGYAMAN